MSDYVEGASNECQTFVYFALDHYFFAYSQWPAKMFDFKTTLTPFAQLITTT